MSPPAPLFTHFYLFSLHCLSIASLVVFGHFLFSKSLSLLSFSQVVLSSGIFFLFFFFFLRPFLFLFFFIIPCRLFCSGINRSGYLSDIKEGKVIIILCNFFFMAGIASFDLDYLFISLFICFALGTVIKVRKWEVQNVLKTLFSLFIYSLINFTTIEINSSLFQSLIFLTF